MVSVKFLRVLMAEDLESARRTHGSPSDPMEEGLREPERFLSNEVFRFFMLRNCVLFHFNLAHLKISSPKQCSR